MAEEMETGEVYRVLREISQEKRRENRENGAALLERAGVQFMTHNYGAHLIVTHRGRSVDFWPGTGKWATRSGGPKCSGRGVFKLLKFLGAELPETEEGSR